jgi:hypothetical protein
MDEQNLNPQMPVNPQPMPGQSGGVLPTTPQISDHISKKKGHWLMVAVFLVVIIVAFVVWIYIDKMNFMTEVAQDQTLQNGYDQPEEKFTEDIEKVDLGNLDAEFQDIDRDLSSL